MTRVKMKTRVMATEHSALPSQEEITFQKIFIVIFHDIAVFTVFQKHEILVY